MHQGYLYLIFDTTYGDSQPLLVSSHFFEEQYEQGMKDARTEFRKRDLECFRFDGVTMERMVAGRWVPQESKLDG